MVEVVPWLGSQPAAVPYRHMYPSRATDRIHGSAAKKMERSRAAPAPPNRDEDARPPLPADGPAGDVKAANEKLVLAALRAEELAEASAKEEALFNALPDIVVRVDRQLLIVYVNAAVERVTGRNRSRFLGKTESEALGMRHDMAADWDALILEHVQSAGRFMEKSFTLRVAGRPALSACSDHSRAETFGPARFRVRRGDPAGRDRVRDVPERARGRGPLAEAPGDDGGVLRGADRT